MMKTFQISNYIKILIILNLIFITFFITLEINVGINYSSKSVLSNLILNNYLDDEIPVFGHIIQNIYNISVLTLNTFSIKKESFHSENFVIHTIFLISPVLWIVLFNIICLKKRTFLNLLIFISLFCNPIFWEFIHYAWRQSLALSIFIIIWYLNIKYVTAVLLSLGSTLIHFGILPTVTLMIIFEFFKDRMKVVFIILSLLIVSYIIAQIFPFPKYIIPEFFPYYERLTLSFDTDSYKNLPINNIHGNFILRYFFVGILPIIFITILLFYKELSILDESKNYNIILAGSFPLILFATIPTANRLSYFLIFICIIYGPEIFLRFLNLILTPKISFLTTLLFLISGHFIIYFYFKI